MSPSRKSTGQRGLRRSHARHRHDRAVPRPAPSGPPALAGTAVVPIPPPGDRAGDPHEPPDAGEASDVGEASDAGEASDVGVAAGAGASADLIEVEGAPAPETCDANGNVAGAPACAIARHVLELGTLGWDIAGFRPRSTGDEPALWHVTIERYDESATMTVVDEDLDVALTELLRYARADAS
jgi:hypothetical protein